MPKKSKIINQQYAEVALDTLKPHPMNPRRGDVAEISKSIAHNGFYGALVVQKSTGHILAGNHRYLAAKEQGMASLPVIWVNVDEVEAQRILLADNRTSDLGGYDNEQLAALLDGLAQGDGLEGTGYKQSDLDALLAGLTPPDADAWGDAFDAVPDGDKEPFQQMTFTLHDSQVDAVKEALSAARNTPHPDNANSNGNALWALAEAYNGNR